MKGADPVTGDRLAERGGQEPADTRHAVDDKVLDDLDPNEDDRDGDDLVAEDCS
ncbi:MAG: hypothetical protein ACYDAQ_00285 [Mycobacteriales bacterium]